MSGSCASLNLPPHNFFGSSPALALARVVEARRARGHRRRLGTVASSRVRDVTARDDVAMARDVGRAKEDDRSVGAVARASPCVVSRPGRWVDFSRNP